MRRAARDPIVSRWASWILQVVTLIVLWVIAYLTRGSPVSLIAGGVGGVVLGAGWWITYAHLYESREFTPWLKFQRVTHVAMFAGFGLWYIIDGLRKMLTS